MVPEPKDGLLPWPLRGVAHNDDNERRQTDQVGDAAAKSEAALATEHQDRRDVEVRQGRHQDRRWPRRHSSADPTAGRRLGLLEYTLLALIALGIAITIAMAIINPSG
ncbi:MAG: hypothetical protein ACRDNK_07635 [Solirubrobacteraceae bacterium]